MIKMRKELTQDALDAYAEREKALAELIADNLTEQEAQREIKVTSEEAIKKAKTLIANAESDIADATQVIINMKDGIAMAEHEIEQMKADIAEHEYNVKYNTLMKEQKPFWDAATTRLAKIQAELKDELPDFVDFLEPEEAIEKLKQSVEKNTFTQYAVDIRGAEENYSRLLIDLVMDKLDGKKIRLARHQERNSLLDRFLKSDAIEKIWNRG
jgi:flagellar basal body P-ring protein FlgI